MAAKTTQWNWIPVRQHHDTSAVQATTNEYIHVLLSIYAETMIIINHAKNEKVHYMLQKGYYTKYNSSCINDL